MGLEETATHPGLPALDYLRDEAGLTGVKYACREGDCGSCVILLGHAAGDTIRYRVVTSCLLPVGAKGRSGVDDRMAARSLSEVAGDADT